MKHISVEAFKEVLRVESTNPTVEFLNVCTPAEYKEKHIKGVKNLPLDEIERRAGELKDKRTIFIHCRSGRRGEAAIKKLESLGITADLVNVEGGLLAWEAAGFETGALTARIPIIRQTMIAAGALILGSVGLATVIHPSMLWITAIVGAGLLFAGVTGWCGMALLLARAPWNR